MRQNLAAGAGFQSAYTKRPAAGKGPAGKRRNLLEVSASHVQAGMRADDYRDGTCSAVVVRSSANVGVPYISGGRPCATPCAGRTPGPIPPRRRGEQEDVQQAAPAQETSGAYVALIESRAKEVGIAALDSRSLAFDVTQFTDSADYSRTLASVLALEPAVVVMSRTARGTHLFDVMSNGLERAGIHNLELVERRYFDETEGQARLEKAEVVGIQQSDYAAKFVACAALAAVWRFAESSMESRLSAHAVRVTFHGPADTMIIDTSSARLLELVASPGEKNRNQSTVFGLFSCRTPGGARMLRQSLLQPPATCAEIRSRQAALETLLSNEELFHELRKLLPLVSDLDTLAARVMAEPKTRGTVWCKAAIRTAVRLHQAFTVLPQLGETLQATRLEAAALLQDACEELVSARFPGLVRELERVIDPESPALAKTGAMGHAALLYSVRPGICALLDVARQTWSDALEQVHALHRRYVVMYPELNIKLEFTERRGWYFSHGSAATVADFVRTERKAGSDRSISTTKDLNTENFKLRQAEREILTQTLTVLGNLFDILREEGHILYRVAHTIATLDLIQALAGYTLLAGDCVKPEVTDDACAPIAIKAGRHPLMESIMAKDGGTSSSFDALDFFIGEGCSFQAITGANGGGKSTYLQTLAQLVVLAQVGCFIPAQYALIRVVPSLFTRIGSSDNLSASASTFLVEMQEAAHILQGMAHDSLVLIDELGRGTAHVDGIAICWSICERLLEQRVYTLFATHFFEVCRLQSVFSSFRNMHLEVCNAEAGAGEAAIEPASKRYTVRHISSLDELLSKPQARYGLSMAEEVGLPQALLQNARTLACRVDRRLAMQLPYGRAGTKSGGCESSATQAGTGQDQMGAAIETARQLLSLAGESSMSKLDVAEAVVQLQRPWQELRGRPGAGAAGANKH